MPIVFAKPAPVQLSFDVSNASYDSLSFSVNSQESGPAGFAFSSDGTKMYVVGYSNKRVYQYTLSTAWVINTASYDSVSFSVNSQETVPLAIAFKSDGTKMYVVNHATAIVHQYTLSTGWDLSTASYDSVSFNIETYGAGQGTALAFSSAGTKMFALGLTNDTVYQFTLSTPWDLSTASYDTISFSVGSQDTSPRGIAFKDDGTKMYILGDTNGSVFQYSL